MSRCSSLTLFLLCSLASAQGAIVVDHNCTDLTQVPAQWIQAAKSQLHIAYGHTSHGSQVTTGMTGLISFTGGCGGPQFDWNHGGTGGALDLHDYAMGGDVGYYPDWVNNTNSYLQDPNHAGVNVIMWSWCGQHATYSQQDMIDRYLTPMAQLEQTYPQVTFVYMTGHLEYGSRAVANARNQQIRDYCHANGKVLFDFADIESYNPEGRYYAYAEANCDYFQPGTANVIGNWASEWQNSHVQGVDWYLCQSEHSEPLNANRKAYAIWWLWARLAGWSGLTELGVDRDVMSWSAGGTSNFQLDAGAAHAGAVYVLVGSLSGTGPGTPLNGSAVLPLNFDPFSTFVVRNLNGGGLSNFVGFFDANGRAGASLTFPMLPAGAEVFTMHFAYALFPGLDFASNAVSVRIIP